MLGDRLRIERVEGVEMPGEGREGEGCGPAVGDEEVEGTNVAPALTALGASGVVLLMLGAGATHLRRGEQPTLPVDLLLGGLALFVAIERFGPHSL